MQFSQQHKSMRNCNQCPIFSPFLTLSRRGGGAFEAPLAKKKLTSDYVIVSTKLCPQVGNDEYIIVYNFGGGRMSGFRVTEGGLRGPPTTTLVAAQIAKKKKPSRNRVKTEAWRASETAQLYWKNSIFFNLQLIRHPGW